MVHLTTALDPASAVPLYEQLYRSLAAEMRAGTMKIPRIKFFYGVSSAKNPKRGEVLCFI